MNAPNTFSTYDLNQFFNFSITFANGYALSTLLPNPAYIGHHSRIGTDFSFENKIEIAIVCNDELIQLSDDDTVAFVDPTQLAQVIAILSGLPLAAYLYTTYDYNDMVTEAGFAAIRSILSPTMPVNFQASLHTLSNKKA